MIRKFATQTFKDKTDAISAVFILSPPQFSIQQGFFPLWKNLRRFLESVFRLPCKARRILQDIF